MKVLGMLSGTSHDGIDAAYLDLELHQDVLVGRLLAAGSVAYPAGLRERLLAVLPPHPTTLAEVAQLDAAIGKAFAAAARTIIDTACGGARDRPGMSGTGPDVIVSHGQTVYHWVRDGHAESTLQIGQAAFIAEALRAPVLCDVRIADIAAGGHGAPLAPLLDALMFGHGDPTIALNLGGIANITLVGESVTTLGYDVGPANALIDAAVRAHGLHPENIDRDGAIARFGTVNTALLEYLLADPFYALPPPRSTGKEYFHQDYLRRAVAAAAPQIDPADLVATLTELTAVIVARAVHHHAATTVVASGGGAHNAYLMERLAAHLPGVRLTTTQEYGVPVDLKEAVLFAVLGWYTSHGLPAAVPSATGARGGRILGAWHAGPTGLDLPDSLAEAPRRFRMERAEEPGAQASTACRTRSSNP